MKITQERLEKFWRRCGFQFWKPVEGGAYDTKYPTSELVLSRDLPELTLDNLFKYAVPLVSYCSLTKPEHPSYGGLWLAEVRYRGNEYKEELTENKDPALALFEALERALEVKE